MCCHWNPSCTSFVSSRHSSWRLTDPCVFQQMVWRKMTEVGLVIWGSREMLLCQLLPARWLNISTLFSDVFSEEAKPRSRWEPPNFAIKMVILSDGCTKVIKVSIIYLPQTSFRVQFVGTQNPWRRKSGFWREFCKLQRLNGSSLLNISNISLETTPLRTFTASAWRRTWQNSKLW